MLKVTVNKRKAVLTVRTNIVTSGARPVEVNFEFSPEWNGLKKMAVFRSLTERFPDVEISKDNIAVVPDDALDRPDTKIGVGIYGENLEGEMVINTRYIELFTVLQGCEIPGQFN